MAAPLTADPLRIEKAGRLQRPWSSEWFRAAAILCIAVLGVWWVLAPYLFGLWAAWTENGLRSVGMLVPPAVVLLVWRAWCGRQWNVGGTWWGLAICALTMLSAAFVRWYGAPVILIAGRALGLLPIGFLLFTYASGVVLLFAGREAYRLALFPLALLLLVNPMPQVLLSSIDLPLQYIGAHTARNFASLIGVPLESNQLRLMFSPALGMFIAPGCNGLRGALAMGLLTLVVGYLYKLPVWLRIGYFVAGVVLAYLLNLVRLCGLVLCYRVALSFEPLARHMEAADYVLGSLIFFSAAVFLFALPRRWNRTSS